MQCKLSFNVPIIRQGIQILLAIVTGWMFSGPALASPSPWGNLSAWEGHYPSDNISTARGTFFTQPSLETALRKILSSADRLLLLRYAVETQIRRADGYDILSVCQPHDCPADNATLIFDPNSSTILVAFFSHKGDVISTRWYGTADYTHLPPAVLNEFLWGHEPKP